MLWAAVAGPVVVDVVVVVDVAAHSMRLAGDNRLAGARVASRAGAGALPHSRLQGDLEGWEGKEKKGSRVEGSGEGRDRRCVLGAQVVGRRGGGGGRASRRQ